MNNILAYDEEFILYMRPFLTILFFLYHASHHLSTMHLHAGY